MKKYLFIFAFLTCFLNAEVITHTSTKTAIGEGYGLTRQEAINNAIIEALGKIKGVDINSVKLTQTTAITSDKGSNLTDIYNEHINKATKGRVDSYEIISANQDSTGKWVAVVEIKNSKTTKSYKAPGLDNKQRRSLVVFNATSTDLRALGENLKSHIITNLTKSRKFNILDRDNSGYYEMEKALISSSDAKSDDIYKLKNVIGSDYLMIFDVKSAKTSSKQNNLTGKNITKSELVVDYQVILFATREIKYSNTLAMSLSVGDDLKSNETAYKKIADKITSDILNAIYPLKIASVNGKDVVFTQNLNVGERFECFSQGKALKDSYTKQSTSDMRVESRVGEVEITRAESKLSYAKIIEGQMKEGFICRPLGSGLGYNQGRDANYELSEDGGVNLGF
ncbi:MULTISPECIES: CsgG/HfaB family protein [Campylobacter]|uniref:CsgG/HfaB family protein n=1 Tax=Campylobacter porcelli TaxID=1660073 RepID=A0ABM8DSL1_9BACT|nr:CsgG/HfaB family protein [Campylobacter sp. P0024]MCR8679705.1 LPP20 family lipoprotein [Campylobacter sp. RM19072]MEE3705475.1 CsgG/HfaB family protein [Campylobacter sp. CX2-8023-23]MEE3745210.1 CsgG/HfaB family protein [Campylobacter sp. CX2-4855-23]